MAYLHLPANFPDAVWYVRDDPKASPWLRAAMVKLLGRSPVDILRDALPLYQLRIGLLQQRIAAISGPMWDPAPPAIDPKVLQNALNYAGASDQFKEAVKDLAGAGLDQAFIDVDVVCRIVSLEAESWLFKYGSAL